MFKCKVQICKVQDIFDKILKSCQVDFLIFIMKLIYLFNSFKFVYLIYRYLHQFLPSQKKSLANQR